MRAEDMKRGLDINVQKALTGFAAGVMVAASVWSLIIPAMEQSDGMGRLAFLPTFAGFWIGVLLFAAGFTVMMALDVALG